MTSEDLIRQHAYLVARGVRAVAIVGTCGATREEMLKVVTRLEQLGCEGAIPFVVEGVNKKADFGYAMAKWVVDLLRWLRSTDDETVPSKHKHRIVGLLLGYSVESIRLFEERCDSRIVSALGRNGN